MLSAVGTKYTKIHAESKVKFRNFREQLPPDLSYSASPRTAPPNPSLRAPWLQLCYYRPLLRPGRGAEYCDQPVCLCFCVTVCPRACLWNRWTHGHEILFADLLWLWLGPLPAALRYIMYFRFYG